MKVIELINVSKCYDGSSVLSNIQLVITKGEMVAITGKSGKGKTTLLNVMGLITDRDGGDLNLFNYSNPSINSKQAMLLRRNKIGYIFQNCGLVDEETVLWNLNLALEYKKMTAKAKREKIDDYLNQFGLADLKNKKVYQLSGGEQQRIAVIRLMLQDSELILADEPTASLDNENEKYIMEHLQELNQRGKTVVVVTHNTHILHYFTRVIQFEELQHGSIRATPVKLREA
ncbi:ATP-binding cassette domain-containing protein [Paenibacillus xylaniclasticus]|uniref:ATP-binding cassette domain-containing protein n=1 Tax=Paenibacillus xylaniclasticus TaxID=588083 RepID=UPI000FDC0DEA|nr:MULTISPECIES: ATP-binding cassette domain-containing protein [Paenibacillus]GFN32918.1 bacteriocin ABC transporter ATP-binding protein [Paenibacillus curdlanolyticus]